MFAAVRLGVELTEGRLGSVRLDSGDLALLATQVRELLDSLGAERTKIIVTSDLDEYTIAALSGAPVDGYGVGTALVTGSGHPTCGFVYKLVARATSDEEDAPLVGVAKKSIDKTSIGGRKYAARRLSAEGVAEVELIGIQPAGRPSTTTTGHCSSRWCGPARSWVNGRSRRPGSGTGARARSCRSRR